MLFMAYMLVSFSTTVPILETNPSDDQEVRIISLIILLYFVKRVFLRTIRTNQKFKTE